MDADGQGIKGLGCWVDDGFGAVRARGPEAVNTVPD